MTKRKETSIKLFVILLAVIMAIIVFSAASLLFDAVAATEPVFAVKIDSSITGDILVTLTN